MECLKCNSNLKKVNVKVQDAQSRAISHQCPNCDYFDFEKESIRKVINKIKNTKRR